MIVTIVALKPSGNVLYIAITTPLSLPNTIDIGPFDIAALQGMTLAQRRQTLLNRAREMLIATPIPNLGISPGDTIDIGT